MRVTEIKLKTASISFLLAKNAVNLCHRFLYVSARKEFLIINSFLLPIKKPDTVAISCALIGVETNGRHRCAR